MSLIRFISRDFDCIGPLGVRGETGDVNDGYGRDSCKVLCRRKGPIICCPPDQKMLVSKK